MPPIPAEQLPRYPHHTSAVDLDRVQSFDDWLKRVGLSEATGRRMLRDGRGPRVTPLSERRIGIRERDHIAWLDARSRDAAVRAWARPS